MGRHGIGSGGGSAKNGFFYFALGGLLGFITDFLYQTNAVVGHNVKLAQCNALTMGDAMQLGGIAGLNAITTFANNFTVSSIAAGMMAGNVTPKILAMMGKPRYLIYDMNASTGAVNPILRGKTPVTTVPGVAARRVN